MTVLSEPIQGDFVGAVMLDALACLETALEAAQRPVGTVSLIPGGLPAWDNCCENGGQAWVRLVRQFPTLGPGAPWPNFDTQQQCGVSGVGIELGVGINRCSKAFGNEYTGAPPSADRMTGEALGMTADAFLTLRALRCCTSLAGAAAKFGQWSPQGAGGGCVGGEWSVLLLTDVCACP